MIDPYKKAKFLISLSIQTHYNKPVSIPMIFKDLGLHSEDMTRRKIIAELVNKDIIQIVEDYGNMKLYSINYKKLERYIRQTEVFKLIGKFIENTVTAFHY